MRDEEQEQVAKVTEKTMNDGLIAETTKRLYGRSSVPCTDADRRKGLRLKPSHSTTEVFLDTLVFGPL